MPLTLDIPSRIHDYRVTFHPDLKFAASLPKGEESFWVVDANVARAHPSLLAGVPPERRMLFDAVEEKKSLDSATAIWDAVLERGAKKNLQLVTAGGGITQDVTGFAASTLYRGVRWTFLPTTLLAQADSCIGGKTSLNHGRWKNLAGTFYPPHEVHVAAPFLDTLADADFFSGLGEVIKLHLMGGKEPTRALESALPALRRRDPAAVLASIQRSLEIKLSYMAGDEFDAGRRNLLNFGHCFGHALESSSAFAIPHGQAVTVGMVFANLVAVSRGKMSERYAKDLNGRILLPNLVTKPSAAHLDPERIVPAMKKDKKRVGVGLALVIMDDAHDLVKIDDLSEGAVIETSAALGRLLGS